MIITSECENCIYGEVYCTEKKILKVHCDKRDRHYYFGQCIPCEDRVKRKDEEENADS